MNFSAPKAIIATVIFANLTLSLYGGKVTWSNGKPNIQSEEREIIGCNIECTEESATLDECGQVVPVIGEDGNITYVEVEC